MQVISTIEFSMFEKNVAFSSYPAMTQLLSII